MSKKLNAAIRTFQELLDRYGEEDIHVRQLRGEIDVLESQEFLYSTRLPAEPFEPRVLGSRQQRISSQGFA
jgi:hypothetical protein